MHAHRKFQKSAAAARASVLVAFIINNPGSTQVFGKQTRGRDFRIGIKENGIWS